VEAGDYEISLDGGDMEPHPHAYSNGADGGCYRSKEQEMSIVTGN